MFNTKTNNMTPQEILNSLIESYDCNERPSAVALGALELLIKNLNNEESSIDQFNNIMGGVDFTESLNQLKELRIN